ncbi:unknown [Eubacterium sp. CAG:786]|nr:unknown [Eubacterium sp. CAG:786]
MDKVGNGLSVLAEAYLRQTVLSLRVLLYLVNHLGLTERNNGNVESPRRSFLLVGGFKVLLSDERKAQVDHVDIVALFRCHRDKIVVQLLLVFLVQREYYFGVLELRCGELQLAHL